MKNIFQKNNYLKGGLLMSWKKIIAMVMAAGMVVAAMPVMAKADEPVKFTVWCDEDGKETIKYLDAFNEAHPEYEAEITYYQDDDLKEQLTVAISAGTAPTVIRGKVGSQLSDYVSAGAMMPLNDYAEQYGWYDMMYEDIEGALTYDGNLYEVPIKTGGKWGVLYYNADMAEELGLDLSEDITLDEMIGMKETVEEAGYQLLAMGNIDLWPALIMYGDYMMQLTTPDTIKGLNDGSIKWNECEAVLSTFEAMQKLGTSGALISGYESLDHISANQAWAAGKTLFMYCGTWWPSTVEGGLEGCPFEVHTILLPQAVEGQKLQGQQFFANEGYGINANATKEEADAAAAFLDYYFNIEGQKMMFADLGTHQANKTFNENLDEYGCKINPLFQEDAFERQSSLPQCNYADWGYDTSVIEELKDRMADLLAGTITPQEAAESVQEAADEVME